MKTKWEEEPENIQSMPTHAQRIMNPRHHKAEQWGVYTPDTEQKTAGQDHGGRGKKRRTGEGQDIGQKGRRYGTKTKNRSTWSDKKKNENKENQQEKSRMVITN